MGSKGYFADSKYAMLLAHVGISVKRVCPFIKKTLASSEALCAMGAAMAACLLGSSLKQAGNECLSELNRNSGDNFLRLLTLDDFRSYTSVQLDSADQALHSF